MSNNVMFYDTVKYKILENDVLQYIWFHSKQHKIYVYVYIIYE